MATEKRLIDANDALARMQKAEKEMKVVSIVGYKAVPMDGVIEFIQTRPTVDAVEVVRCKDCFHYGDGHCLRKLGGGSYVPFPMDSDDFCSYGERENNA